MATGDMAGFIQVCDVNDNMKLVWEYEMGDMSWMRWHTVANVLLAGAETGETYVWLIPSGDCKVLQGNGHKSETAQLTPDGKSLVVGYADGSVKWWDIKSSSVVQSYEPDTPLGHTEAITCIITLPDNKRFISGSTDGKLMIASTVGPLGNFFPNAGPIEALAISPDTDGRLFVCGTLTGRVSVWDVARQAVRVECHPNDGLVGITNIIWLAEHMFACSTLDGSVQLFDSRDGQNVVWIMGSWLKHIRQTDMASLHLLMVDSNLSDYRKRFWATQQRCTTSNIGNTTTFYSQRPRTARLRYSGCERRIGNRIFHIQRKNMDLLRAAMLSHKRTLQSHCTEYTESRSNKLRYELKIVFYCYDYEYIRICIDTLQLIVP